MREGREEEKWQRLKDERRVEREKEGGKREMNCFFARQNGQLNTSVKLDLRSKTHYANQLSFLQAYSSGSCLYETKLLLTVIDARLILLGDPEEKHDHSKKFI